MRWKIQPSEPRVRRDGTGRDMATILSRQGKWSLNVTLRLKCLLYLPLLQPLPSPFPSPSEQQCCMAQAAVQKTLSLLDSKLIAKVASDELVNPRKSGFPLF